MCNVQPGAGGPASGGIDERQPCFMSCKGKGGRDVALAPICSTGYGGPGLPPVGCAKNHLEIVARGPSCFTFDPAILAVDKTHPGPIHWNIGRERGTLPGLAPIARVRPDSPCLLPCPHSPPLFAREKLSPPNR